jgi:hypothetical protein
MCVPCLIATVFQVSHRTSSTANVMHSQIRLAKRARGHGSAAGRRTLRRMVAGAATTMMTARALWAAGLYRPATRKMARRRRRRHATTGWCCRGRRAQARPQPCTRLRRCAWLVDVAGKTVAGVLRTWRGLAQVWTAHKLGMIVFSGFLRNGWSLFRPCEDFQGCLRRCVLIRHAGSEPVGSYGHVHF